MANTSLTKEEAMEENAFETCPHMKHLCDIITKVRVPMSKPFSNFNFLTIINVSYTNLEDEGTLALVNALENSAPSLKAIEMAGNYITYEAAPDLAACLAAKKHLKRLNLSKNDLRDWNSFEIVYIIEALELKYVDMSYNNLRSEGALNLAYAVVNKEGFEMLNIDGNMISYEGVEEVREIFKDCPELLGPLDENNPDEGDEYDDENWNDEQDYENWNDEQDYEDDEQEYEDFEDEFVSVFHFY